MTNNNKLILQAGSSQKNYWLDLWRYRELFFVLAWRDISVRYKQTIIGLIWAIIQPVITMVVFSVIFGKLANLPSEGGAPYMLMVYCGLLPWQLFSASLVGASGSLTENANLINKVYFPRLIMPASSVVVALVDFLICFTVLLSLMFWYAFMPGWRILALPFFVIMAFMASLGPGLFIAALNVKYRDFRYIIPFIVQLGLYISPVGFASSIIPNEWRLLYSLNPMVGVIDGFRWCILGGDSYFYTPSFILGWLVIGFFLWAGISQFRNMEKTFADLV